jgi:hypothetical protein
MTQVRITLPTGQERTITGDKISLTGDLIKVWRGSALVAVSPSTALVEMIGEPDEPVEEAAREYVNEIVADEF